MGAAIIGQSLAQAGDAGADFIHARFLSLSQSLDRNHVHLHLTPMFRFLAQLET